MKIITDSTADMDQSIYEKYSIGMVPLTIHLGDKTWRDFYDVKPDDYYEMLRTTKSFPTTSQPSPLEFAKIYEPLVEKGEQIISIHLCSKLSGTYQSAMLAKSRFSNASIEVIDSKQASLGLALIVILCAEKAEKGASFEEVVNLAKALIDKVDTYFSVDSLNHLQKGGRIGKAQAFLGTLMKVKPLLTLNNGEIQPFEKIRTTERLLSRYVELVTEAAKTSALRFTTGESDNSTVMNGLLARLSSIPGATLTLRCKLGGVITSHSGPGTLAVSFVKTDGLEI
jgi:DegV family protein with EDD domain